MRHHSRLRPITRRRLAWLVALLLLWQQVALAAYACTVTPGAGMPMPMSVTSSMPMGDHCPSMHAGSTQGPLCQAHCHADHAAQPEARSGSVPASLLATLPPDLPLVPAAHSPSGRAPERLYRLRAPPPPASLLFCSLLI
jgi:hypothetical protein